MKSWGASFEVGRPKVAPGVTKWGPQPEADVACSAHNIESKPKAVGSLSVVRDKPRAIGSLNERHDVDDVDVGAPMLWGGGQADQTEFRHKRVVGVMEGWCMVVG